MAQSKDLYDWSTFTASDSAIDLLGHMIRWGISSEKSARRVKFKARVLTPAGQLAPLQVRGIDGTATGGTGGSKVWFKARILGPNSPHAFLPDPCDPSYFSDPDYVYKLIQMHTTFLAETTAGHATAVTRGDIVSVELEATEASYNLQHGKYLKLLSQEDPPSAGSEECAALIKLFGQVSKTPLKLKEFGGTPGPTGHPTAPAPIGSVGPTPAPRGVYGQQGGSLTAKKYLSLCEVYQMMKELYPSPQYHPNLVLALMANMDVESAGFQPNIGGDLTTRAGKGLDAIGCTTSTGAWKCHATDNPIYEHCSHGMFQMNVCGKSFMGGQFLVHHKVWSDAKKAPGDPIRAKQLLNDPIAQLEFVRDNQLPLKASAAALQRPHAPDKGKNGRSGSWALWFQENFENMVRDDIRERKAQEFVSKVAECDPAPPTVAKVTPAPPACKGPNDGGVAGTDFQWTDELPDGTWDWECIV